jgi:uncharacterized protein
MKSFSIFIVFFIIISTLFLYFFQRHLIYFPSKEHLSRARYNAHDMQKVVLKTDDGIKLISWYKKPKQGMPVLLYFHGNAGHIGGRMPFIRNFLNKGLGVFLLEYRGYAQNKGSPSEKGFYKDGKAAIEYLQKSGVKLKDIVLYGESIGSGVATQIGYEYPVCAMILQSPFTSLADVSKYHYPWIVIKPKDVFDSITKVKAMHQPLLIIHGKQDTIVPYTQGETLYLHANKPKKMLSYEGRGHNDLWQAGFVDDVMTFITTYCITTL